MCNRPLIIKDYKNKRLQKTVAKSEGIIPEGSASMTTACTPPFSGYSTFPILLIVMRNDK